jgi:pimeloyl-ACP methyl ester carboxylesterase
LDTRWEDRSSSCTARATRDTRPDSLSNRDSHGGTRNGWSRASAASQATRSLRSRSAYGGDEVSEEEWARVYAAFGLQVPDEERESGTPKNLELNSYGMDLMRRLDIVDQLSRVDSPTLVSVGELDPVTPVAAAEEIVGALPEGIARLEVIAGAGHFTWLDAPDRFWPIIIEFVQGRIAHERVDPTLSENGQPIGSGAKAGDVP